MEGKRANQAVAQQLLTSGFLDALMSRLRADLLADIQASIDPEVDHELCVQVRLLSDVERRVRAFAHAVTQEEFE